MARPEIVRLYGRADSFDLEFEHVGGTRWKISVPPDTQDGVYAVDLTAINSVGMSTNWVGELFMVSGKPCFHMNMPDKMIWFVQPSIFMRIEKRCVHGL